MKASSISERISQAAFLASTGSEESSETSSMSETNDPVELNFMQSSFQAEESTLLHRSSLILKRDIKDTPGLSCTWPPTSEDLNILTSENVIPPSLF